MKNIIIPLSTLLLLACNQNTKTAGNQDLPFFHFDQIEYYHKDISKKELQTIGAKEDKTRKEQALLQILTGNVPVSIKDTLFIKNMDILGFEKDTIDAKLNPKISHLFSLREVLKPVTSPVTPDFGDVLIFRRDKHIIGMAKISFDGSKHQMIGERYNDSNFGQSGEYKELEKILKQYKQ
ncbi:hypothetical protein NAT51_13960 [Flavobacterium amniphilum]|uniref:hypothetical protein n=1 Tax=Flavobacterium amniphilum TaxID=1834035 RepID=UPI00202A3D6E|nr:hypothetical protein [Flavobacterium amniphilum]MCL9806636.1 hypothetical protein [Flavobacterium amniphilum]